MKAILDTNLLLEWARNSDTWKRVQNEYDLEDANLYACTVSFGELRSISGRNGWGEIKKANIERITSLCKEVGIEGLDRLYAEIEIFSMGKDPNRKLPKGTSARNMGQNDLWIAAACYKTGATLFTSDYDFEHLQGVYLKIEFYR